MKLIEAMMSMNIATEIKMMMYLIKQKSGKLEVLQKINLPI